MRHPDLNVYFFDRNNGAKVFALALGAPYIRFDGGEGSTTLNPFATPDSSDNRAFLRTWLRDITGCTDALSEQEIARAVTTAFEYLRPEERLLKTYTRVVFHRQVKCGANCSAGSIMINTAGFSIRLKITWT